LCKSLRCSYPTVRALYGLKSSGATWRACLAEVLRDQLGFQPCRADNDVWFRPAQRPDGTRYYEYVLVYTDNILCLSCDPKSILCQLDQHFLLKPDSIGPPTQYLGSSIGRYKFEDGDECWCMGSEQYVTEAIRNVTTWLEQCGLMLKTKVSAVLPLNYLPDWILCHCAMMKTTTISSNILGCYDGQLN
jgi:hypothetical protein